MRAMTLSMERIYSVRIMANRQTSTTTRKKTTSTAKKYEQMMEDQLEVASFANVNYGRTDWIKLERRRNTINKRYYWSGIMLSVAFGVMIFSILIFVQAMKGSAL